jgi:Hemerythrin HHE cation binding domain
MDLLTQLEIEHARIGALLDDIKESNLKAPETQSMLQYAKKIITEHIQFEDERFYPLLDKATERDKELHKMVTRYSTEMSAASKKIEKFVGEDPSQVDDQTYIKMFDAIYELLKKRIRSEEMILFREYMKSGLIENPEYD